MIATGTRPLIAEIAGWTNISRHLSNFSLRLLPSPRSHCFATHSGWFRIGKKLQPVLHLALKRKFTMSRQRQLQRESQKGNRANFWPAENANVQSNSQPRFFAQAATRCCNIVAILFRMVATLFQHCNAVLRRIVSYNITLTVRKFRRIAVQSSVWTAKNIERSRVNDVSGQIFLAGRKFFKQ